MDNPFCMLKGSEFGDTWRGCFGSDSIPWNTHA